MAITGYGPESPTKFWRHKASIVQKLRIRRKMSLRIKEFGKRKIKYWGRILDIDFQISVLGMSFYKWEVVVFLFHLLFLVFHLRIRDVCLLKAISCVILSTKLFFLPSIATWGGIINVLGIFWGHRSHSMAQKFKVPDHVQIEISFLFFLLFFFK